MDEDPEVAAILERHMEVNSNDDDAVEHEQASYEFPDMGDDNDIEMPDAEGAHDDAPDLADNAEQPQREESDNVDDYWEDEMAEGDLHRLQLFNLKRLRPEGDGDEDSGSRGSEDSDGDEYVIAEDPTPEEHAGGMILPMVELSDVDLYYRELFHAIRRMGIETTRLLVAVVQEGKELTETERYHCGVWVNYWTSYLVENHYVILGNVISTPTGPDGAMEKMSGSVAMTIEIWRLKLVLNYHRLRELSSYCISDSPFLVQWLLETPGVPLDCPPKMPVEPLPKTAGGVVTQKQQEEYREQCIKYNDALAAFNSRARISETPVLRMRQSQARTLLQFLTERMKIIPYHDDIRHLFSVLELKMAMFYCQTMPGRQLDEPAFRADLSKERDKAEEARRAEMEGYSVREEYAEAVRQAAAAQPSIAPVPEKGRYTVNRDFWFLSASYWMPIQRSLYLLDRFHKMQLQRGDHPESYLKPGTVDRMKAWCLRMALQQKDNFQDRLEDTANEALRHEGDGEWFDYRYPEEANNVDVILRKVRGEPYYDDYHTQLNLSPETLLSQANRNWLANCYIVRLFDRYMDTHKQTKWRNGYVIENAFIDDDDTFQKWTSTKEPMLVNLFSNYWLLLDCKVLPINDIYTALCIWMLMLRRTREIAQLPADCLFDHTYIGDVLDHILEGKDIVVYTTQPERDAAHLESLKRDIPVPVTRMHI